MPGTAQNGQFKVTGFAHRFAAAGGFISQFKIQEQ